MTGAVTRQHSSVRRFRDLARTPVANGLDPKALLRTDRAPVNISGGGSNSKAWRDIWSAGQGIGAVKKAEPAADYIGWLVADYARARTALGIPLS